MNFISQPENDKSHHKRKILPNSENIFWKCNKCKDITFTFVQDFFNHLENKHMSYLKSELISCCLCTERKEFKTKRELDAHLKKIHLNKTLCYFCNTWFQSSSKISEHIKVEHNNCQYLCKICNQNKNSRTELNKHLKDEHSKVNMKLYCSECPEQFSNYSSFASHIKSKHQTYIDSNKIQKEVNFVNTTNNTLDESEIFMDEEFLENEFLDEIFFENDSFQFTESWLDLDFMDSEINDCDSSNKDLLEKESKECMKKDQIKTTVKESYNCPKCSKCDFFKLFDLKLHLAHDHNEYILNCRFCDYMFNRIDELNAHQSQHISENMIIYLNNNAQGEIIQYDEKNSRIFKCKQCLREFHKEQNFLVHICESLSSKNTGNAIKNTLKCSLCEMNFKNLKEAYKHKKNIHNINPIECIICDKQFKTKVGLEYHLKAHTGIKTFVCPYCQKKFTANMNLNAHIRTVHSTIKGHECKLCDRKFSTLDHLKKHVTSVHQKERNHQCNICGKGFAQKSHLAQHTLIHTGEKRFYCEFCLKGFIKRIEKSKHMKKCIMKNEINMKST